MNEEKKTYLITNYFNYKIAKVHRKITEKKYQLDPFLHETSVYCKITLYAAEFYMKP